MQISGKALLAVASASMLAGSFPIAAEANNADQMRQAAHAARRLKRAGCDIRPKVEGGDLFVEISCNNSHIVRFVEPVINRSFLAIYNGKQGGRLIDNPIDIPWMPDKVPADPNRVIMDWRFGGKPSSDVGRSTKCENYSSRNTGGFHGQISANIEAERKRVTKPNTEACRTAVIKRGPIHRVPGNFAPVRIYYKGIIKADKFYLAPYKNGFHFSLNFNGSVNLNCHANLAGTGYSDNSCPDLRLRKPKLSGYIQFNRRFEISSNSRAYLSGDTGFRGKLFKEFLTATDQRDTIRNINGMANGALHQMRPQINGMIRDAIKEEVVNRVYGVSNKRCIRDLKYANNNLKVKLSMRPICWRRDA